MTTIIEDISELKVMQSNAGYYVGIGYNDMGSTGHPFPYSRDSEYFKTHEEAVEEVLIEMDYLYGPNLRAMTHAQVTYHKWLRNFELENTGDK